MMNRRIKLKTAIALMFGASAVSCALLLFAVMSYAGFGTDLFREVRTYIALMRDIDSKYIGEYDAKSVSEAAFSAAVGALGDKWSYYMTPEAYKEYLEASANRYSGLGIRVKKADGTGGLLVLEVFPGSPAEVAGLVPGDVITAVDGADVKGMALRDAAALIGREPGQSVQLTVLDKGGQTRYVDVKTAVVSTDPVRSEMLAGSVGYLRIENFEAGSADAFIRAADELVGRGARALVFDVRDNGGGRVSELRKMLDYLLPECDIFVAVDRRGREEVLKSGPESLDLPAAVLVNSRTYSAAEYFAAVLKEYGYAVVVGERTTGKNRSQITLELPDGGALHISSGEYLTPRRVSLAETGGLSPDAEVSLTEEESALLSAGQLDWEKDAQLKKALELLGQL